MAPRFTSLAQWLAWLETLHPNEIDLGLLRVYSVAVSLGIYNSLDNTRCSGAVKNKSGAIPQVVTVAGTNGKGSFVKTQEQLLLKTTKTVGCFTSPHILHYNERICINGKTLTDQALCDLFATIDQARGDISLTYFEFSALAALLAFHEHNCDYWILEVGLGGRLDAANIIDSTLSVITSIGFDHEQWLGDTLEQIAAEKAGVIRSYCPVVLASKNMPAVIAQKATELNAVTITNGEQYSIDFDGRTNTYTLVVDGKTIVTISNPSLPIQSMFAAVVTSLQLGVCLSNSEFLDVLQGTALAGRFEIIHYKQSHVILDVAHNPMATQRLAEKIKIYKKSHNIKKVYAIMAMMADKNIASTLTPLLRVVDQWQCCAIADNARAEKPQNLVNILHNLDVQPNQVKSESSIKIAATELLEKTSKNEVSNSIILVFGSFFTVSHAKNTLLKMGIQ